jgi:hypothetical protein
MLCSWRFLKIHKRVNVPLLQLMRRTARIKHPASDGHASMARKRCSVNGVVAP